MNIDEINKRRELEREEIWRKEAEGQSFEEYVREKSALDVDILRKSSIFVKASNGKIVELKPKK